MKKSRVKKLFAGIEGMWFEPAMGSDVDNKEYCSKDEKFYEFGSRVSVKARRVAGAKKGGDVTKARWVDVMSATRL